MILMAPLKQSIQLLAVMRSQTNLKDWQFGKSGNVVMFGQGGGVLCIDSHGFRLGMLAGFLCGSRSALKLTTQA